MLLFKSSEPKTPADWSRDGRFLLFNNTDPKTGADIWVLPMGASGSAKPEAYLKTDANEGNAHFSPDGRFGVYTSNESGIGEIYVRTFPDPTRGKWTVSKGDGQQPRWSRDGKELFYLSGLFFRRYGKGRGNTIPNPELLAVDVNTTPTFRPGIPKALFPLTNGQWDAAPDGKRFLALRPPAAPDPASAPPPAPITVVLNWAAGIRK